MGSLSSSPALSECDCEDDEVQLRWADCPGWPLESLRTILQEPEDRIASLDQTEPAGCKTHRLLIEDSTCAHRRLRAQFEPKPDQSQQDTTRLLSDELV